MLRHDLGYNTPSPAHDNTLRCRRPSSHPRHVKIASTGHTAENLLLGNKVYHKQAEDADIGMMQYCTDDRSIST